MRKLAVLLLLLPVMLIGVFAIPASAEHPDYIEFRRLYNVEADVGFAVAVLISSEPNVGLTESAARQYAREFYLSEIGNKEGIILLINKNPSPKYHYIYYHNSPYFNDERIEHILDYIWTALIDADDERAIREFENRVRYYHRQGKIGTVSLLTVIIIMAVATIGAGVAIPLGVVAAYKIRPAKCAHEYLIKDSVNYRQKSDTFIRTHVSKVKIQSSSSSGGGGRSSGGGGRRA
jgi:uncharacterized membrane protein YgcG